MLPIAGVAALTLEFFNELYFQIFFISFNNSFYEATP